MKKINTIKKYREFKEILNKRKFYKNELYCVYFRKNDYNFTRIGILVTKKNGNAVVRNKIKRQTRSIIDSIISYNIPVDIIVTINKKYDINSFQTNCEQLSTLLITLIGDLNE
ncbi:MAG: ribonuclease P protein component [Candidatus Onthovivens sp.]|nr:ribonuclease P protein component [Candidatus Onthovivens sp.]